LAHIFTPWALLIPQKKLEELIEELAEKRAKEITDMAQKNSAIEKQAATQEAYRRLLEQNKNKIIENRKWLWPKK
jgi:hypothetical protein